MKPCLPGLRHADPTAVERLRARVRADSDYYWRLHNRLRERAFRDDVTHAVLVALSHIEQDFARLHWALLDAGTRKADGTGWVDAERWCGDGI